MIRDIAMELIAGLALLCLAAAALGMNIGVQAVLWEWKFRLIGEAVKELRAWL